MDKFTQHRGICAPLLQSNIDTDVIIPSREMKRVSKKGLGEGLFANRRYTLPGGREPNMDFVLNKPEYAGTSILLCGKNFGCGSSREHAVWALKEYGIRAIIAAGFGSIFYNNCIRNGILPLVLEIEQIESLAEQSGRDPQKHPLLIDLESELVKSESGSTFSFEIKLAQKVMLLEGLDAIDVTLKMQDDIRAFRRTYNKAFPWLN